MYCSKLLKLVSYALLLWWVVRSIVNKTILVIQNGIIFFTDDGNCTRQSFVYMLWIFQILL